MVDYHQVGIGYTFKWDWCRSGRAFGYQALFPRCHPRDVSNFKITALALARTSRRKDAAVLHVPSDANQKQIYEAWAESLKRGHECDICRLSNKQWEAVDAREAALKPRMPGHDEVYWAEEARLRYRDMMQYPAGTRLRYDARRRWRDANYNAEVARRYGR